jgi:hypothetical protein
MSLCASWAWAVVATLPVPMAHTGSYAITILLQEHAGIGNNSHLPITKNAPPIDLLRDLDNRLQLSFDDLRALARFALFKGFSDTEDHRQSSIDRSPGLLRYELGSLLEEGAALGMTWVPRRNKSKRGAQIAFR